MQGELERLSGLDPKGPTYNIEFKKIQDAKLKEVIDLIAAMVPCLMTYQFFKAGDNDDFISAVEENKTNLIKNCSEDQLAERTYLKEDIIDTFPAIIETMLSLNYEPPIYWDEMLCHLGALKYHYKKLINNPPTIADLRIDVSFSKLLAKGYTCCETYKRLGTRELDRIEKSCRSLKEKANTKRGIVMEIYHRSNLIKPGMKFNTVINIIAKCFRKLKDGGTQWQGITKIPSDLKCPKNDQIRRYLITEGILKKHFIKEGRFWVMQG